MDKKTATVAALIDNAQRRTGREDVLGEPLLARQLRRLAGMPEPLTNEEVASKYRAYLEAKGTPPDEIERRVMPLLEYGR